MEISSNPKVNKAVKELLSFGLYILIVLLVSLFLIKFVAQRTNVQGTSMYPTLSDKDNLLVEKVSYRFGNPKRFDIIVFHPALESKGVYYVKRIIGMPGERIRIDENGAIYINGEVLSESFGYEVIRNPGIAHEEITLGKDEYFVLGDNRNNSTDSRSATVGNVKRSSILGKAWIRIFPFDRFGKISHR